MKKVTIYTGNYCPYCERAKVLLERKQIPFKEIDVSDPEEFESLTKKSGMKTVPQIFFDDELIGGFQELAELDANGEIEKRLALDS